MEGSLTTPDPEKKLPTSDVLLACGRRSYYRYDKRTMKPKLDVPISVIVSSKKAENLLKDFKVWNDCLDFDNLLHVKIWNETLNWCLIDHMIKTYGHGLFDTNLHEVIWHLQPTRLLGLAVTALRVLSSIERVNISVKESSQMNFCFCSIFAKQI